MSTFRTLDVCQNFLTVNGLTIWLVPINVFLESEPQSERVALHMVERFDVLTVGSLYQAYQDGLMM